MKTQTLWANISGIFEKILQHPFITGLVDGSLDERKFRFYVIQDAIYLKYFSRGLAILGTKFSEDDIYLSFLEDAKTAIMVERSLHESFFKVWKLSYEDVNRTPIAPNNLLYVSYLMNIVYERPYYESLGAFLPCYWIYLEVGKHLEKFGSKNELYQKWINTYASKEFETVVRRVLDISENVLKKLNDEQFEMVKHHFVMTSKFEYMFWDMGYKEQSWDV
ncbi:MAG: thiaminase II [candidate division WOR-3 bacterium]|nr:thiaminase II [candidate division WOR-3 bacterium]MDW8151222.1 thiaminase II [candidate division WOR-3 bacterium]